MGEPVLIDQLAGEIWDIYVSDAANAEGRIEAFLESRLGPLPEMEKKEALARLMGEYRGVPDPETRELLADNQVMGHVFSLLLGKDVSATRLSASELIQKLASSLNTIFDSMNRLIRTINRTLYGKPSESISGDKTIRQVIGSHISGGTEMTSIEDHLKQINRAFLISQEAFKASVRSTMTRVLDEIDPEMIDLSAGSRFSVGPFRRAKLFDVYKSRYDQIKKWFASDKFMADFLREFEKNCQLLKKE